MFKGFIGKRFQSIATLAEHACFTRQDRDKNCQLGGMAG